MTCTLQVFSYLICLLSGLSLTAQGPFEPIFQPFEGTVYRLPYDSLNRGYRPYIYDLEPYKTITWQEINQEWRPSKEHYPDIDLSHSFGIDFRTEMNIPTDGLYLFGLRSDDDSILWIDGRKVLDSSYEGSIDYRHSTKVMNLSADTIYLSQGVHDIKLWYSQLYPNMMGYQFRSKFIEKVDRDDYIDYSKPLRLTYETAAYDLTDAHVSLIDRWLEHMGKPGEQTISIIGYADEVGTSEANNILSLQRAQEVGDHIITSLNYQVAVEVNGQGELVGVGEHNRYVEVMLKTK